MSKEREYEELYDRLLREVSTLHRNNRRRIRIGMKMLVAVTVGLMLLMFLSQGNKIFSLMLWILSMFAVAAYLIAVEYADYELQKKLEYITQMQQQSMGALLMLPELPEVPKVGRLLRRETAEPDITIDPVSAIDAVDPIDPIDPAAPVTPERRMTDEKYLEYLPQRLETADRKRCGGGGAAGALSGALPLCMVQYPFQLGPLRSGLHRAHPGGGGQSG